MKKILFLFILCCFLTTGCFGLKCPEGYTLDENKELCYKVIDAPATYRIEYSCAVGYLFGDKCYLVNSNVAKPAKQYGYGYTSYYCDYGYNLVGNMCYPSSTIAVKKKYVQCPPGYTIDSSGIGTGIPQIDVPELEVPSLSSSHCYKRVTTSPE